MITGFRWHLGGAQARYGIEPDLSTFGKALANGFSVSALAGKREFMQLGGFDHDRERVFLLSTTHGARNARPGRCDRHDAGLRDEPVIETLWQRGRAARRRAERCRSRQRGRSGSRAIPRTALLPGVRIARSRPGNRHSHFRTLLMQEMIDVAYSPPRSWSTTATPRPTSIAPLRRSRERLWYIGVRWTTASTSICVVDPVKPAIRPFA